MDKPLLNIELRYNSNGKDPIIQLLFEHDSQLIRELKSKTDACWSEALGSWYIPVARFRAQQFKKEFGEHYYLHANRQSARAISESLQELNKISRKLAPGQFFSDWDEKREQRILHFSEWMKSKRYSLSTIKVYSECLRYFFRYHKGKAIEDIDRQDITDFNNDYILKNGYSSSFQNQFVNALKLFYRKEVQSSIQIEEIERPRIEHRLPNVLSKQEVASILSGVRNQKHRMMLILIYACGLRRGELLRLKPTDIQRDRGLLLIRQGKGNKDRITPISANIIKLLEAYYKCYRPAVWLFEGQIRGEPYSERSIQLVFKNALAGSKIRKPATLHWLRHSYATHLLENGTDLRYIQELLGHKSSRTTEIYTHVSNHSIQKIKSPFDDLDL